MNGPNFVIQEASVTVSNIDDRYMLKYYRDGKLTLASAWKIRDELLAHEEEIVKFTLGFLGGNNE